jgi:hypothetical protein
VCDLDVLCGRKPDPERTLASIRGIWFFACYCTGIILTIVSDYVMILLEVGDDHHDTASSWSAGIP